MKDNVIKAKGVSFNISDDHQRKLYEHSETKSNFSGYVKTLIFRDMLGDLLTQKRATAPFEDECDT